MNKYLKLIEEYQCPGCIKGSDTKCDSFEFDGGNYNNCKNHLPGTFLMPGGKISLGLPRGFNKTGLQFERSDDGTIQILSSPKPNIVFYSDDEHQVARNMWNKCNVPVWAMEYNGDLLVRMYMPRINFDMVQIIQGGTMKLLDGFPVHNVADFIEEID